MATNCVVTQMPSTGSSHAVIDTSYLGFVLQSTTSVGHTIFGAANVGRIFFIGTDNGIYVYDLSNPAAPLNISIIASGTVYGFLDIFGKYLIACGSTTVDIYDISALNSPVLKGTTAIGNAETVRVIGQYAFIADASYTYIVDVSNPALPVQLSAISTGGAFTYTTNGGNTFFVSYLNFFAAYDISNPYRPVQLSTVATGGGGMFNIGIQERYVYHPATIAGVNKILIIDISNPSSMSTTQFTPNSAQYFDTGLITAGKYLYGAAFNSTTCDLYDISNPISPVYVQSCTTTDAPYFATQFGSLFITLNNDNKFQIFSIGGADVITATVGSLEVGGVSCRDRAVFAADISVSKGLAVGGYSFFEGDASFGGSVTTKGPIIYTPTFVTANAYTQVFSDSLIFYNNGAAALLTLQNGDQLVGQVKPGFSLILVKNNNNAFVIGVDPYSYSKTFAPANVNTSTERITITAHGLVVGQKIKFSSSGTLPGGLNSVTQYYATIIDANTIRVCTSISAALAAFPVVNLTSQGTGTHTVTSNNTINGATATGVAGAGAVNLSTGFTKMILTLTSESTWVAYT